MLGQWIKKDLHALPVMVLACLLLPCLFCWLLGNLYVEQIPFGVVDLDDSSLSRQIVHGLEDHPGLAVVFVDDQLTLEQQIEQKNLSAGMIIPPSFSKALSAKQPKELLTIIDATNTLVSNNVLAYVSAVTGTYSAGAMLTLLEANDMSPTAAMHTYNTFQYVDRTLYDPYMSYLSYLVYFLIPYLIQMVICCVFALPLFTELHQQIMARGRKAVSWNLFAEISVRFAFIYLISASTSWVGYCLADYFFGLPVRGTMGLYFILLAAFELALLAIAMMISTMLKPQHCLYFFESYMVLGMVILLTSGAIWLPYLMPDGLHTIVGFFWPFAHVALPFKLLNMKASGWDIIGPAVVDCLQYAAFWAVVAIAVTILQRQWQFHRQQKIDRKTDTKDTSYDIISIANDTNQKGEGSL